MNDDQTLIRAWLQGQLTAAQSARFEARRQADAAFAEEVQMALANYALTETMIENDTRGWLSDWEAERVAAPRPAVRWWLWAALGCIVAGFFIWKIMQRPAPAPQPAGAIRSDTPVAPSPDMAVQTPADTPAPTTTTVKPTLAALASRYYEAPAWRNLRGAGAELPTPLQAAQRAYENKQYQLAIQYLDQADSTQYQTVMYFKGHCLYQLKQYDAAAQAFETLIRLPSRQYAMSSDWALLNCRLAQGKTAAAQQQVVKIMSVDGHVYGARARVVRGEME